MKRPAAAVIAVLLAVIASASFANASGPRSGDSDYGYGVYGPGGFMGMHGDIDRMSMPGMNKACRTPEFFLERSGALGLTDEQEDRMEALYFDLKRDMIEGGARVKVLELELTEIVSKPDFDLDKALDVLKEVEAARTALRTGVLRSSAAARDILTPEQLEKAKDMRTGHARPRKYRRDYDDDGYGGEMDDVIRRKMENQMKKRMGAPE